MRGREVTALEVLKPQENVFSPPPNQAFIPLERCLLYLFSTSSHYPHDNNNLRMEELEGTLWDHQGGTMWELISQPLAP